LITILRIIIGLSMLSLLYYLLIIFYAGFRATFSWFWLFAGIGGFLLSLVLRRMINRGIEPTEGLIILIITAVLTGGGIFLLIIGTLLRYANLKAEKGLDYIIILGAQVRGTVISKALRRRLETAVIYLKDNPETIAIVSGGRGNRETISEAEAMELYLVEKGIKKSRIRKEDRSRNTFENILFSKTFLDDNSTFAIVTNGFHIYRSISIAKKQGLKEVKGLAAPTDKLLCINYYIREAAGVLKDKLFSNI
jgi:uncharacterized SAM-binding protein YcdF (DUF218 family)